MTDDKGFLSRWARRKAQAGKRAEADNAAQQGETPPVAAAAPGQPDMPPFDLEQLPSLDSLTSASDLSVFMQAGVPEALRNAALRRMWVTDPAIRDYIGPADYDWDFNTPGALAGHGELAAGTDIGKLVAQFTNQMAELVPPEGAPDTDGRPDVVAFAGDQTGHALPVPSGAEAIEEPEGPDESAGAEKPALAAAQPPRRRHGSAMPR